MLIISDELFKIKFVEPTQVDNSQRLRAGQDRESHCNNILSISQCGIDFNTNFQTNRVMCVPI